MPGHDCAEAKVVIDVLVAVKIAKLAAARVFYKDRVRIISSIVAGHAKRNALQVFLVGLSRLGRAADKGVDFFL